MYMVLLAMCPRANELSASDCLMHREFAIVVVRLILHHIGAHDRIVPFQRKICQWFDALLSPLVASARDAASLAVAAALARCEQHISVVYIESTSCAEQLGQYVETCINIKPSTDQSVYN